MDTIIQNLAKPCSSRIKPLIINISHSYDYEPSMYEHGFKVLNCTDLYGTEFFCSPEAEKEFKKRLSNYSLRGIHFIDSGNYHYLSKLWCERIKKPFSLILFDHHTDMQKSSVEGLLSCGNWVRKMLEENSCLVKVVVLGASESQRATIDPTLASRVIFYGEDKLMEDSSWREFSSMHLSEPVYVSIDKDVLDADEAITDWDQGSMTLDRLERLLKIVFNNEKVIGLDICGEYSGFSDLDKMQKAAFVNEKTNLELLEEIEREEKL